MNFYRRYGLPVLIMAISGLLVRLFNTYLPGSIRSLIVTITMAVALFAFGMALHVHKKRRDESWFKKLVICFVLLFFLLWLLLSGGVSLHACLWGLAVSALLTWFCRRVLGYDWRIFCGRPARIWALIRYFAHLVAEMLKAGLMVMKIIYVHPKKITPKLVWFRTPLQTDRHKAMLSDSITLTAGTITVRSQDGRLLVHALDAPLAEGIEDTAFQQQLEKMEGTQWRR